MDSFERSAVMGLCRRAQPPARNWDLHHHDFNVEGSRELRNSQPFPRLLGSCHVQVVLPVAKRL